MQLHLICSRFHRHYDIYQNDRRDFSYMAAHQIPKIYLNIEVRLFHFLFLQRLHLRARTARSENCLDPITKILSENHEHNDVNLCIGICKYVNPVFQAIKPIKHGPSPYNVSFQYHWCRGADCEQRGEHYEHAHSTQISLVGNLFGRFLLSVRCLLPHHSGISASGW